MESLNNMDVKVLRSLCDIAESRIFGFIMYTRRHSYVINALSDENKWNELDEISGANWPIFSVQPHERSRRHSGNCNTLHAPDEGPVFHMMLSTTYEPNDNRDLLELFSLNEMDDLPCFVIFIWKDDNTTERIVWKLKNDSADEVFKSIREVVEIVSNTESEVLPEYKRSENLYINVKKNVEAVLFRKRIVKTGKDLLNIINFFKQEL